MRLQQRPLANNYEFMSCGISLSPHCTYVRSFNFIALAEILFDERY